VRFSATGDVLAFVDHPVRTTDSGRMVIVDRQGHSKVLTGNFGYVSGLAWQPDGREIWFAGAPVGGTPAFYGVTMDGRTRLIARVPGEIVLHDIGRDGRALLSIDTGRQGMRALAPGAEQERDLSWLETSFLTHISPDGRMVAFTEWGAGGEGQVPLLYLRPTDGGSATRLGEGYLAAFSPDGRWVLGLQEAKSGQRIAIYPVGPGESRFLPLGGLHAEGASWCPDGERIVFFGFEGGHGRRLYIIDSVEGKPRAISPEGHTGSGVFTRDGKATLGYDAERRIWVYPLDGENPSPLPLPPLEQQSNVVSWGRDGQLLVITQRPPFLEVRRLDPRTGRKQPWKMIAPPDTTGITNVQYFAITPDWSAYAYGYLWRQSDLFVAEGLR
jgi:Tol biopolymer transport system component